MHDHTRRQLVMQIFEDGVRYYCPNCAKFVEVEEEKDELSASGRYYLAARAAAGERDALVDLYAAIYNGIPVEKQSERIREAMAHAERTLHRAALPPSAAPAAPLPCAMPVHPKRPGYATLPTGTCALPYGHAGECAPAAPTEDING